MTYILPVSWIDPWELIVSAWNRRKDGLLDGEALALVVQGTGTSTLQNAPKLGAWLAKASDFAKRTVQNAALVPLLPDRVSPWTMETEENRRWFELCLVGSPFAMIQFRNETRTMCPGELVEVDRLVRHSWCNFGPAPVIHLTFDIKKDADA